MDEERAKSIEERITDLKRRWPAHSVPPQLWDELEGLEAELERIQRSHGEASQDDR